MRDGFHLISAGWMLVDDLDDLTDRIERLAEWTKANAPLETDEELTVKLMFESQIAREFHLPEKCFCCGVYLMGGATRHTADCPIRALIAQQFPDYEQPPPEYLDAP